MPRIAGAIDAGWLLTLSAAIRERPLICLTEPLRAVVGWESWSIRHGRLLCSGAALGSNPVQTRTDQSLAVRYHRFNLRCVESQRRPHSVDDRLPAESHPSVGGLRDRAAKQGL